MQELAGDGQEPAWQRQSQLGPTLSGPTQAPPLPPPDAAAARLAAWVAVLWAGFGFQRGLCAAGLPYDCDSFDAADVFNTLTLLAFLGGALAWLAGVTAPDRFAFLFSWRRAYLGVVYAAILPAYSALGNLPALQASLANTGSWGAGMIAAFALGERLPWRTCLQDALRWPVACLTPAASYQPWAPHPPALLQLGWWFWQL